MACLCGDDNTESVMNYDAFIYVLLRTAADNDNSFRTDFLADPECVLARANHEFRSSYLGDEDLTLPTQDEARALLADYLPDYDGTKAARMNVRFNWTWPRTS